jgi:hypothetical protein
MQLGHGQLNVRLEREAVPLRVVVHQLKVRSDVEAIVFLKYIFVANAFISPFQHTNNAY